jgi:hypothetical protein
MIRILIIGTVLTLALNAPAAAQKEKITVEKALSQLHGLCERDYKPACMKLGMVIGRIPPKEANKFRKSNPEWFWWERW